MGERPILFSGRLVRAILEGRKTQTRRPLKPQPADGSAWHTLPTPPWRASGSHGSRCPYGAIGDLLYARESFADVNTENGPAIWYRADRHMHFCTWDAYPVDYSLYPDSWTFTQWWTDLDAGADGHRWRPSIHMPKRVARIWLRVTDVRVERVRSITQGDVRAEGLTECASDIAHNEFAELWDSINARRGFSWDSNPWVWALTFEVLSTTGRPEEATNADA